MVLSNKFKVCLICALTGITILSVYLLISTSNIRFFVVASESMKPSLKTGDIVIIEPNINRDPSSSFTSLKMGDIIAFEEPKTNAERNKVVVHRVVHIGDTNGERIIRTKGDANPYPIQSIDYPVTKDEYIGKVTYSIPYAGLVLIYLDIIIRVVFPPVLYILVATGVAILIAFKIKKRRAIPA